MNKKNSIFLFLILILASFAFTFKTYAQSANGFNVTLSPTVVDLTTDPGTVIHNKFRIHNNNTSPIFLKITINKLSPQNENGNFVPQTPTKNDQYISWISFDHPNFTAAGDDWTDINFSINVPKDAAFGYYYAISIGQDTSKIKNANEKVLGQVVLPILLNVRNKNAKAELKLINFITTSFVNEYLPVTFNAVFKNTGNVHLRPDGNIFIGRSPSDKDLISINLNPGFGAILPGGIRNYKISWDDGFIVREPVYQDGEIELDSHKNPIYHLVINWNNLTSFRIGKYTATLLAVYDNGTRDIPIEATTTFWVIPYTLFAEILGGLIILFFLFRFLIKIYIKKQIKKYQK